MRSLEAVLSSYRSRCFFAQLAHLSKVDTYVIIEPVSAAVISRSVHTQRFWQTPVLALCGLLFFFVLHAKIAVYGGAALKVTPSTPRNSGPMDRRCNSHPWIQALMRFSG